MPGKGFSTVSKALAILAVTLSVTSGWAVLALLFAEVLSAQTYSVIHNFTGTPDGTWPLSGLTMDRAGNLYGTTVYGGFAGSMSCVNGCGTVYRLSRTSNGWATTILHAFKGPRGDGADPFSRVIFGRDGALYGTTFSGGTGPRGTVFRLSPPAKSCGNVPCPWEESHYSFAADLLSGAGPFAEVAFDAQGNLYGTTNYGGPNYCDGPNSCGVLYKVTTPIQEWNQSVIWNYEQSSGNSPYAGIIFDASGNIFGVTTVGGSAGLGTLYEVTESGGSWTYSVLYNFTGQSDGTDPDGNLLEDAQGNFYGTAARGGSGGGGTVFEFSPSGGGWNFRVLHSFSGTEGREGPIAGLTMDANGNLYGTTFLDGAFGFGNVFKLTKSNGSWNYASLHDFSGGADGGGSYGTVLIDAAGNLYGTAMGGGATGDGVVWEITP